MFHEQGPQPQHGPQPRPSQLAYGRGERPYLERLKHNLYISPGDPLYWQKKLRYMGNDFHTLFQMAALREQEGKLEQALALYRRAEQAASGGNQFSRAVYRRRKLEQLLGLSLPAADGALRNVSDPGGVRGTVWAAQTNMVPLPVPMGAAGGSVGLANASVGTMGASVGAVKASAGSVRASKGVARTSIRPAPVSVGMSAASPSVPVYALKRAGGPSRMWMGLTGLLLGLLLGLLGAMWLVQYRLDVHFYHHPGTDGQPSVIEEVVVAGDLERIFQIPENGMKPGMTTASQTEPVSPIGGTAEWWTAGEPALTYLRTAVWGYYRLNGTFPNRLEELAGPFPANYISGIPPDPVFGERKVVSQWDGTGGWVYEQPSDHMADAGRREEADVSPALLETVARAVRPNWTATNRSSFLEFEPLRLLVLPDERRVMLVTGTRTLLEAEAAVGMPQSPTPAGDFFVRKRVWHPLGEPSRLSSDGLSDGLSTDALSADASPTGPTDAIRSPYGVAGLEFADGYAIHGTYDSGSIGHAVTGGCVRVENGAMRQLFAWTPLGTDVIIRQASDGSWAEDSVKDSEVVAEDGPVVFNGLGESYGEGMPQRNVDQKNIDRWAAVLPPRSDEHDGTAVYFWKG